MIIREWMVFILLMACAWGSLLVFNGKHHAYYYHDTGRYFLTVCSPYLLMVFAGLCWYRCFIWRRMTHRRQSPMTHVIRGDKTTLLYKKERSSIAEWLSMSLFLLGMAGALKHLNVQAIHLWLGLFLLLRWILGIAFIRRSSP